MGWAKFRKTDDEIIEYLKEKGVEDIAINLFESEEGEMCYLMTGQPNDSIDLITFVHGSPGSLDNFLTYMGDSSLLNNNALISVDRLGLGNSQYGKSEKTLYKHGAVIKKLIKQFPARRHILVGHSYGCSVLARMAMDYPDLVSGIILIGAPLDPELEPSIWYRKIMDFPLVRIILPPSIKVSNQELMPLKQELEGIMPMWDMVKCPVVFVHGGKDTLVPVGNVDFGEKKMRNSVMMKSMVDENDNHFIIWSQPRVIKEAIESVKGYWSNME